MAFTTFSGDKEVLGDYIQSITIGLEDVPAIVETADIYEAKQNLGEKNGRSTMRWLVHYAHAQSIP